MHFVSHCIDSYIPTIMKYYCTIKLYSVLQIGKESIDFFPVNKAKCLEKKEEDETKKQLAVLKTMVKSVLSRFEKQVHTMIHVDFV